jgi:hypothetical protein
MVEATKEVSQKQQIGATLWKKPVGPNAPKALTLTNGICPARKRAQGLNLPLISLQGLHPK